MELNRTVSKIIKQNETQQKFHLGLKQNIILEVEKPTNKLLCLTRPKRKYVFSQFSNKLEFFSYL